MTSAASPQSRVLIVEDSPTQALQLRALLESQALTVSHALNAEAALEFLNGELPDLVIADYHLPGMNGDELARQIRSNIRTRALPILMLTQDDARGSERHGLESGADGYVAKSSDKEILLLRINALLRQQAGRAQDLRSFTHFRPGRILTVHTSGAFEPRLSGVLAKDRYVVTTASSLGEAEQGVAAGVDCVLVDMTDAALDGYAVCRALDARRARNKPGNIDASFQIVALVADANDRRELTRCYVAGVDDILSLATESEHFKLRVRTVVRRNAAREENLRIDRELREQQVALANAAAKAAAADAARMAELLEGERRFRTIFDTGYQLIWLLTPEGTIIVANQTVVVATGDSVDDIAAKPLWQTAWWKNDPAEATALRDRILQAAENRSVRFETTFRQRERRGRTYDFSLRPALDSAGQVVQVVAEAHDVTDFKETEAALRQSQKMEAIGQITGGVAHDFNNLLMAILANLELLRKRLPDNDPTIDRYIEGAVQGANRGASLTQRLLAFARKQDLQSEPVDIALLLRNMESLLERSAGPSIRLRYDISSAMQSAQADPNQLELAILNLVVNARDAMPSGGQIAVEADQTTLERQNQELVAGAYVRIRIVDNGEGMDRETRQRAIEPFFSTKEVGKGTGLGLSMVHGMAMQLGGALRLRSELGKGTIAELWLPVTTQAAATSPAAPAESHAASRPGEKATILVLDDDALISMSMVDMLEDLGHVVIEANTAQRALEILGSDATIDLLITDFAMPQMTGGELAVAAKKLRPQLPILLATGYADIPAGGQINLPRIAKPYDQAKLASHVDMLLHGPVSP